MQIRLWRRPRPPRGPQGGPACGRRPRGCLPSPWSSANAAIFQPARVISGAAGAGAGVGAGWGQGCPTPAGPHVPAGHASGTHGEGQAAPCCGRGPGRTRLTSPSGLGSLSSASARAEVPLRLHERWARATAVLPPSTSLGLGIPENVFWHLALGGGGGIGDDVEGALLHLPVL